MKQPLPPNGQITAPRNPRGLSGAIALNYVLDQRKGGPDTELPLSFKEEQSELGQFSLATKIEIGQDGRLYLWEDGSIVIAFVEGTDLYFAPFVLQSARLGHLYRKGDLNGFFRQLLQDKDTWSSLIDQDDVLFWLGVTRQKYLISARQASPIRPAFAHIHSISDQAREELERLCLKAAVRLNTSETTFRFHVIPRSLTLKGLHGTSGALDVVWLEGKDPAPNTPDRRKIRKEFKSALRTHPCFKSYNFVYQTPKKKATSLIIQVDLKDFSGHERLHALTS